MDTYMMANSTNWTLFENPREVLKGCECVQRLIDKDRYVKMSSLVVY